MSSPRRIAIVITALVIAGILLRPQLSSALLARGDSLAYWGDRADARRAYERALAFDPHNGAAADRLTFQYAFSGDRAFVRHGIAVATSYLELEPADAEVRMDRALCYHHLSNYVAASHDFQLAGTLAHDPRALMFAALDEKRVKNAAAARRLLRLAIAIDGHFLPAARALSEVRR